MFSGFLPCYQDFRCLIRMFTVLSGFSLSYKYLHCLIRIFSILSGFSPSYQEFQCLIHTHDYPRLTLGDPRVTLDAHFRHIKIWQARLIFSRKKYFLKCPLHYSFRLIRLNFLHDWLEYMNIIFCVTVVWFQLGFQLEKASSKYFHQFGKPSSSIGNSFQ